MNKAKLWIIGGVLLAIWFFGGLLVALICAEREGLFSSTTGNSSSYQIRFGVLGSNSDGTYFLAQETSVIPLKLKDSGFRYGMSIVPPDDQPYTLRCVFHFSSPPKMLSGEIFDGKQPSTTVEGQSESDQGATVEEYWFDPGDPLGKQSIDVFVNGKVVKVIHYTVIPSNEAK